MTTNDATFTDSQTNRRLGPILTCPRWLMLAAENRSLPVLSACKRERTRLRPTVSPANNSLWPACAFNVETLGWSHVMHHNTTPTTCQHVSITPVTPKVSSDSRKGSAVPAPQKPADLGMQNRCGVESGNKLKAAATVVSMVEMRVFPD
jgi:hypothetical protein